MRKPEPLPPYRAIFDQLLQDDQAKAVELVGIASVTDKQGRYLHWDELKYRTPPKGFTHKQWWAATKLSRTMQIRRTSFTSKEGDKFTYVIPRTLEKELDWLNLHTAGSIVDPTNVSQIINPNTKASYLIRSFINEAISSSQMEGAATTRAVAKEMLRKGRKPKDKSEQMIANNYEAMQFIQTIKNEDLTLPKILRLHNILTTDTLDDPNDAGRLRTKSVSVVDERVGTILHEAPNHEQLPERVKKIIEFANSDTGEYVNPVIKAIILHFMLAYDHPFVDGNGRTARALFYWAAARRGYWLMEYVSISEIIKKAQSKYGKAFLFTESDDGDLTYFIVHQLRTIKKGIDELIDYLKRKSEEISSVKSFLMTAKDIRGELNPRQIALLISSLNNPGQMYTVAEHQRTHGVTYETARKDLLKLADELHFLTKYKQGKTFIFEAPVDLKERIEQSS